MKMPQFNREDNQIELVEETRLLGVTLSSDLGPFLVSSCCTLQKGNISVKKIAKQQTYQN